MKKIIHLLLTIYSCILLNHITSIAQEIGHWESEPIDADVIHRHECAYVECDGKFYLMGGRKLGVEKYTNIYDPITQNWTKSAASLQSTSNPLIKNTGLHHFQPVVYNHKIYILSAFTGNYPDETPVDRIYIYDPALDQWSEGPIIPVERRRGSAGVVVVNDKFYVACGIVDGHNGGYVPWFDEYNPQTNEWKIMPDAPNARDHFHAATLNGKIYLAGGRRSSVATNQTTNLTVPFVDVFDFSSQSWETWPNNIPTQRAGCASVILGNDLLVIGGEGPGTINNKAFDKTEALNLVTKTWRTLAPMDTGRHATQAIVFQNKVYIAAGSKTNGGNSSSELVSQEIYHDPSFEEEIKLSFPDSINFGKIPYTSSFAKRIVTLQNSTSEDIQITNITIRDNYPDFGFNFSPSEAFPILVPPLSSRQIELIFSPTGQGEKISYIDIEHTGINNPASIELRGEQLGDLSAIKNKNNLKGINLFPNPVKDYLHLSDEKNREGLYWEVLNSSGNRVKNGINIKIIDFTEMPKGLYIINVLSEKTLENTSLKVIKD